jgi:TonB-dependent receptor
VRSHFGTFELGIKIRDAHKYQVESDKLFNFTGNAPVTLAQVQGSYSNPGYYDKQLTFGPTSDYNKILQVVSPFLGTQFTRDANGKDLAASAGATWDARERVYAGYAMNTIGFGKVRLQTGLRIEATDTNFVANQVNLSNGVFQSATPINGSAGYINVLPRVQVQYLVEKNTNLRFNYGMGISRPNFSDIVPSLQVDPNTTPQTLQIGNPALKPTRANNYDILVEHYFQPLGILQGGFFYKQLSNPIYPTIVRLTSGTYAGFLQQQSINGPSAHISGVEAAWEQRLSFLPGLLSGFGVSANYSYTTSRVTFPAFFSSAVQGGAGRTDHPSLQRQAPNTWNLGFTYDKARFSMRFGVSHNDANIYAYGFVHDPNNPQNDNDPILGLKGPLGDQYLYAHTQFDIQGSYRLYKGLKVVASGLNLSNEVFGFFTSSTIYPNQREFYKPSLIVGMRWTSSSE